MCRVSEKNFYSSNSTLCFNQGCRAATHISDSSSRHLKFLAPVPERFGPLKTKVIVSSLPRKVCLWNRNPNSGSGSTTSMFFVPAPQPWFQHPGCRYKVYCIFSSDAPRALRQAVLKNIVSEKGYLSVCENKEKNLLSVHVFMKYTDHINGLTGIKIPTATITS